MKTQSLALVILLLGTAGFARADQDDGQRGGRESQERHHSHASITLRDSHASITLRAPEIDPASMVAALTLLGGALAVLRGRRNLKPIGQAAKRGASFKAGL
jgi:hypothetical protein